MNANELADLNEWSCCAHSKEVSAMLRQQQAEIEVLKKKIQNMALDLLSAHAQADDHWVELERLRKALGK